MLRILIADGHEIVRRGVRSIVEAHPGWSVAGEAADGPAALEIAVRERPDIAIIDASLPILDGVTLTARLRLEAPQVKVLLFASPGEDAIDRALAAGAFGYVPRTAGGHYLDAAIMALSAGEPGSDVSNSPDFTARELEVVQLIAEGQSNKRIARRLAIGVKTVESHRSAAMRKAGAHTAVELVRFALRRNLVRL